MDPGLRLGDMASRKLLGRPAPSDRFSKYGLEVAVRLELCRSAPCRRDASIKSFSV